MNTFREKVKVIGEKGLRIIDEYLDGGEGETDKIREASKAISNAIKIEHMDQIKDYTNKSLAIRLLNFLPKDEELRKKYIEMTNPDIKPLLLDRPKKK